jgi:hypothetical protein
MGGTPHFFIFIASTFANCWRMANRPVPDNRKAKAAGISLPPQLINQARKHAYKRGMSLSGFVRQLLIERLGEEAA